MRCRELLPAFLIIHMGVGMIDGHLFIMYSLPTSCAEEEEEEEEEKDVLLLHHQD